MERELLLLGILRRQNMHGYQLAEFIDHNLASCTDLKKSTAYFLLEKMYKAGWITYEQDQEGNRPPRRVYILTKEGEAAFQQLLRENLSGFSPVYFAGDVGYAFLNVIAPQEAADLLRQRRKAVIAQQQSLQDAPQHPGGAQWMVEHQIYHLQTELKWLDEIIHRVETTRTMHEEI